MSPVRGEEGAVPDATLTEGLAVVAPDISSQAVGDVLPIPTLALKVKRSELISPYMKAEPPGADPLSIYNLLDPVSLYPALYPKKILPLELADRLYPASEPIAIL